MYGNNSDLIIRKEDGEILCKATTIENMPNKALKLKSKSALNKSNLIKDVLKGYSNLNDKTIRVAFKKDIQEGLDSGIYTIMSTKKGELLADAVDSTTGKVVGKSRVVTTSKLSKIATGVFQVASIAVAQSHLADIETSLKSIKSSLSNMQNYLEATELGKIEGAIEYLAQIAKHMESLESPDMLSNEKSTTIESIIKNFFQWEKKLSNDFNDLLISIEKQEDTDWFGTGDTYEALRESAKEKFIPIVKRHELLMQLASLITYITTYLDPLRDKFTVVKPSVEWFNKIESFESLATTATDRLISNSLFNTSDTLRDRKENIKLSLSKNCNLLSSEQKAYHERDEKIRERVSDIFDNEVTLALTFDSEGGLEETAILT